MEDVVFDQREGAPKVAVGKKRKQNFTNQRTSHEQKLQTELQTATTVRSLCCSKYLKSLVGAPGLEPGTR
jgi:hypothetical protein